jgi:hypothetical protein
MSFDNEFQNCIKNLEKLKQGGVSTIFINNNSSKLINDIEYTKLYNKYYNIDPVFNTNLSKMKLGPIKELCDRLGVCYRDESGKRLKKKEIIAVLKSKRI